MIKNLQRRQTEVGRIRIGQSVETSKTDRYGKPIRRPAKLQQFRFTSPSQALISQVAECYGGQVQEWQPQGGGAKQWEVYTNANSLPVVVPPRAVSQWYEAWAGGVCVRRCDGERELLKDQPCVCPPDPADRSPYSDCKPTTRISLMLAEIPGIGVWRLETNGYYAATELPAVAELLAAAGGYIQGRLELEERSARREKANEPGVYETRRWMVPVLHVDAAPAQLLGPNLRHHREEVAIVAGAGQAPAIAAAPESGLGERLTPGRVLMLIPEAKNRDQLAQLWAEAREVDAINDTVKVAFEAHGKKLNNTNTSTSNSGEPQAIEETAAEPAAGEAEPVVEGEIEPDREQTWMLILAEANKHGWDLPAVQQKYRDHMGHDPAEEEIATGWLLDAFLDDLRKGKIQ